MKRFIPVSKRVIWWDVENIAFHLDKKQEKWLTQNHISVRGFMGREYDKRLKDDRIMRFKTQLPEQSDHAISMWSGKWLEYMDKKGVPLKKLQTCVMTKDKFADAWAAILNQNNVKAARVSSWKDIQKFFS